MRNLNELHAKLPQSVRYVMALSLFGLALSLRLWMLPLSAGFQFITFYPAMVTSFYLCGIGPGFMMAVLSALSVFYVLIPPYFTFDKLPAHQFGGIFFLFSAALIGTMVKQLQNYARQSRGLFENSPTGMIAIDPVTYRVTQSNGVAQRMWGYTADEFLTKTISDLTAQEMDGEVDARIAKLVAGSVENLLFERRYRRKDGSVFWGETCASCISDRGASVIMIGSTIDVSERKNLELRLQQLTAEQSAMLDNELVGIAKVQNRHLVWKNKAIDQIFGYEAGELDGESARILFPDVETFEAVGDAAYAVMRSHGVYRAELAMRRKDGRLVWMDASGVQLPGENQNYLWMFVDISAAKEQRERIEQIAYHDVLTDLPNRLLLFDRLEQALAQAERSNRYLAVCYLDLDGFKPINDTFGHDAGDRLLQEVGRRMQRSVRANDTAARFGGDEFVILLTDLVDVDEYKVVLQRIVEELGQPIVVDPAHEVVISASVGVTLFPADPSDADGLIRHADQAMYLAKRAGRNCISLYSLPSPETAVS